LGTVDDFLLLAEVIEAGGFTAASRRTGIPKSRLSRRIAQLEHELGVLLLHRGARRFQVTDLGRQLYGHGVSIRAELEAARILARDSLKEPSGTLRIACPTMLATAVVGRVAAEFAAAHEKLRVTLHTVTGIAEPLAEQYDLIIQPSTGPLADSGAVARQIIVAPYALVATPDLIARAGHPKGLAKLDGLDGIGWAVDANLPRWRLLGPDREETEISVRIRFSTDNLLVVRQAAMAGAGIARLPLGMCRDEIASGALAIVAPDWAPPPMTIYALFPSRKAVTSAGRLFVDALTEALVAQLR
jgi:DNA-binding transcriptional LysR family regulator